MEELAELLPQYEFHGLIGRGGMGAVYLARQPALDRMVAIKVLPPLYDDQAEEATRFITEARSMARLVHPHIVAVHDFGQTTAGHLFLVMEYVEGTDLHHLIAEGQINEQNAHALIAQICDAIQFAHEQGVMHRDIKPLNILISTAGQVKVADFGLAKDLGHDPTDDDGLGTPEYAAPERYSTTAPVDHRADIYSLGVVIHEMLSGETPQEAAHHGGAKLPDAFVGVMSKCLMVDPARRYQSAREVKAALALARKEATEAAQRARAAPVVSPGAVRRPVPRQLPANYGRSSRWSQLFWTLATLLVLAGVGWYIWKNEMQQRAGATAPPATPEQTPTPPNGQTPAQSAPDPEIERLAAEQLGNLPAFDPELSRMRDVVALDHPMPSPTELGAKLAELNGKYVAALRRDAASAAQADQAAMLAEADRVAQGEFIDPAADVSALPAPLARMRGILAEQTRLIEKAAGESVAAHATALRERIQPLLEARQAAGDAIGAARVRLLLESAGKPVSLAAIFGPGGSAKLSPPPAQ